MHGHDLFLKRVGGAYNAFIESTERNVRNKCKEDLLSTTRYITWSLHTRNGCGLKGMLGDVRSSQHVHCATCFRSVSNYGLLFGATTQIVAQAIICKPELY